MKSKAFTLLELMLAMALLSLIIFAVNSAELNARRFLNIDLARSMLIRDGSYVLDEIAKMIKMGSSVTKLSNGIQITINDPQHSSQTVQYYKTDSNELYCDNSYLKVLAGVSFKGILLKNVIGFAASNKGDFWTVSITLWDSGWKRWDPDKKRAVILSTSAKMEN